MDELQAYLRLNKAASAEELEAYAEQLIAELKRSDARNRKEFQDRNPRIAKSMEEFHDTLLKQAEKQVRQVVADYRSGSLSV